MTVPDDPVARLEQTLRGPLPPTVAALDPEVVAALADTLQDAKRRLAEVVLAALDESMRHVPLPLRGLVRKVLGV
jgi:hypothetical protein